VGTTGRNQVTNDGFIHPLLQNRLCRIFPLDGDQGGSLVFMRRNGTVKFFNQAKGYGFVTPDGGGKDIFVHITAVQKSGIPELNEGTKISFDVQDDAQGRGPQAIELQLI
jgi:CspA family cold shock protein